MRTVLILLGITAAIVLGAYAGVHETDTREQAEASHRQAIEQALANREVMVGMTTDEARKAWGAPLRVTVTLKGSREAWGYRNGSALFFERGRVTGWRTKELTTK